MRLKSMRLTGYKAFDSFAVDFGQNAFLVGPNNAGGHIDRGDPPRRRAAACRRQSRPATFRRYGNDYLWSYPIPSELIGSESENLRHKFRSDEAKLKLTLDSGLSVEAIGRPSLAMAKVRLGSSMPTGHGPAVSTRRPATLRGEVPFVEVILPDVGPNPTRGGTA